MTRPGGAAGFYLITAALVGLLFGLGLALIGVWGWTVSTSTDAFGRQIAQVLGVAGAAACAPALIWVLAFMPWMHARIAEGRRPVVVRGWLTVAVAAVVGAGGLFAMELIA